MALPGPPRKKGTEGSTTKALGWPSPCWYKPALQPCAWGPHTHTSHHQIGLGPTDSMRVTENSSCFFHMHLALSPHLPWSCYLPQEEFKLKKRKPSFLKMPYLGPEREHRVRRKPWRLSDVPTHPPKGDILETCLKKISAAPSTGFLPVRWVMITWGQVGAEMVMCRNTLQETPGKECIPLGPKV